MEIENAIEVLGLTRYFGELLAVDHVSFDVKKGEIFGLLGPNGAGKTTTIKMLTTLLWPSDGSAKVWGYDIQKEREMVRKSIGIVFQDPSLDMDLTGFENMKFHARLYGLSDNETRMRAKMLLDLVELSQWADKLVKTYSGGMKRRLEIARGLLHKPKVLFLDEPTLGLDPQSRRHVWNYITEINRKEEVTILLTTHYMEEADSVCNRVAIIDRGKIVALDKPNNLKNVVGGDVVSMEIGANAGRLLEVFKKKNIVETGEVSQGQLILTINYGESLIPKLMRIATEENVEVKAVSLKKPSLDDVFFHFTGRRIREEGAEAMPVTRMRMRRGMR